jgi:hypothetical protein
LTFLVETKAKSKECLIGLSPIALCRIQICTKLDVSQN